MGSCHGVTAAAVLRMGWLGPARVKLQDAAPPARGNVSSDEVAQRMPFPLGNRWRLGFNASAFSCAFLGAVGRSLIVLLTKTGPRCISFRCKITVSLAQSAVNDAEADVADPVFVRSTRSPFLR